MSKPQKPVTPVSNRERVKELRAKQIQITPKSRLADLLVDPELTKRIFAAKDDLYKLLLAYQQSIVAPGNAAVIGHTVLGISSVQEFLDQVAEFGREDSKLPNNQTLTNE